MTIDRILNQVILTNGDKEIVERLSPEEALKLASELTKQADKVLKSTETKADD